MMLTLCLHLLFTSNYLMYTKIQFKINTLWIKLNWKEFQVKSWFSKKAEVLYQFTKQHSILYFLFIYHQRHHLLILTFFLTLVSFWTLLENLTSLIINGYIYLSLTHIWLINYWWNSHQLTYFWFLVIIKKHRSSS